jgi:hypothetical protein
MNHDPVAPVFQDLPVAKFCMSNPTIDFEIHTFIIPCCGRYCLPALS